MHKDDNKSRRGGPKKKEGGQDMDQKILDLARVTRVMAGGKRMRFRACVAIGDKKGKVGIGLAKGADVSIAINKAVNNAKKNLILVPLIKDTIAHEIKIKEGAAKLLFKPAPVGTGIKAGGVVRVILELAGVQNISAKILGTNNKINNAKATVLALTSFKIKAKPAVIVEEAKEIKTEEKKEYPLKVKNSRPRKVNQKGKEQETSK